MKEPKGENPSSKHEYGHRAAELRSIAIHEVIAERLDNAAVDRARALLRKWVAENKIHPRYAQQWEELLVLPLTEIRVFLVEDNQKMRDLRQNTPFAGLLSDEERKQIIRGI